MISERQDDKFHTPEYESLREMAYLHWEDFCRLIGEDCMTAAIICRLRAQGQSLGHIQMKLKVSKSQARYNSKDCVCEIHNHNFKNSAKK